MADIDYREEIADIVGGYKDEGIDWVRFQKNTLREPGEVVDQILRAVIAKDKACDSCRGGGLIGGSGINDMCFDCHGTGKLDITIDDLIKKELGG